MEYPYLGDDSSVLKPVPGEESCDKCGEEISVSLRYYISLDMYDSGERGDTLCLDCGRDVTSDSRVSDLEEDSKYL
jgi:hypothetical protein